MKMYDPAEILQAANDVVALACERIPADSPNRGGYLTVLTPDGGLLVSARIGEFPVESCQQFFDMSLDQAIKLHNRPSGVCSRRTRNPNKGRFEGAVRLEDNYVYSFFGLPEKWNEACAIVLASHFLEEKASSINLQRILSISNNELADILMLKYARHLEAKLRKRAVKSIFA